MIGVPMLLVAQKLPIISALYSGAESKSFILQLLGLVLGVGLLEETCKAIPFFLFALRKKEAIRPRDGIILGMMCGFGFALAEIVQYSVWYWGANAYFSAVATTRAIDNPANFTGLLPRLADLSGSALLAQVSRFITAPLLHACWAGVVGFFIAAASCRTGSRWPSWSRDILLRGSAARIVRRVLWRLRWNCPSGSQPSWCSWDTLSMR